jgi:hypothetical protein
MPDDPAYQLAKVYPDARHLALAKDDLIPLAATVWRRMGRSIEHPTELLDQVVLAHQREEGYEALRAQTKQRLIEKLPRHLLPKVNDQLEQLIEEELESEGELFGQMTQTADGQVTLVTIGRWAEAAYPTIQLAHTFAAGLMATNISKEIADEIRLPFPAILLEVPSGLLDLETETGALLPITRILITRMPNTRIQGIGWAYIALTPTPLTFWRFGCKTEDMLGIGDWETHKTANPEFNPFSQPITDRDERLGNLIGRLILNVCLAMADPANVKPIGPGHKAHAQAHHRRQPGPPVIRNFQVGKPLKHDFRRLVTAYLHGEREYRELSVQTLVAGHWKRQPYGEARALRKTIWIVPYWRGPEDAPIIQRPHVLGKETTKGL